MNMKICSCMDRVHAHSQLSDCTVVETGNIRKMQMADEMSQPHLIVTNTLQMWTSVRKAVTSNWPSHCLIYET